MNNILVCPQEAKGMANSEDPDQTALSVYTISYIETDWLQNKERY